MHPRFGLKKVYHVKLSACPTEIELGRLRKGIRLGDGMTAPARVRVLEKLKKNAWIEIEIHEGRNREVRRMFEALGYFIEKLSRVELGNVELGRLARGEIRPLMRTEIIKLKRAVGLQESFRAREKKARRLSSLSCRFRSRAIWRIDVPMTIASISSISPMSRSTFIFICQNIGRTANR